MRTRYALFLCLLPGLAVGQTAGSITFSEQSDTNNGGRNDGVINIVECAGTVSDALTLSWTLNGTPATGTTLSVYASTDSNCPPTTNVVPLEAQLALTRTGSGPYQVVSGILAKVSPAIACPVATTKPLYFCVTEKPASGSETSRATGSITLDGTVPDAPTNVGAGTGDGALYASWTAATGGAATATSFTATATAVAPDATHLNCNAGGVSGRSCSVTGSGSTSCRITGLTNYGCYDVTVVGYSDSKNPSPASLPAPGVPMPVEDFWMLYQADGGREQGGCGQGAAGLLALAPLLLLAPRLRRRRP